MVRGGCCPKRKRKCHLYKLFYVTLIFPPKFIYNPDIQGTSQFSSVGCHFIPRLIKRRWGTSDGCLEFNVRKCFESTSSNDAAISWLDKYCHLWRPKNKTKSSHASKMKYWSKGSSPQWFQGSQDGSSVVGIYLWVLVISRILGGIFWFSK